MGGDQRSVESVFKRALGVDTAQRASFLRGACGSDTRLRAEVEALLGADQAARGFLASPFQVDLERATSLVGCQVGEFRLERVIGTGGMGVVFEASQDHPRRTVALKMMLGGMATDEALRRFAYEAEVLAHLRHPGIATIHAAGVHAEGALRLPWFAMEHVPGAMGIVAYAETHDLPRAKRLELFLQVCDAVGHGHGRGVLHRDLKPANILVDETGVPRVIDFGIARPMAADASLTVTSSMTPGTLRYMAPEHCAGRPADLDVRADVYALGLVLYELLAGAFPYDLERSSALDVPRIIRDEAPTRLSANDRTLRGDLDVIVHRAIEKDRDRRYGSVAALGSDVRRHLDGRPIEARRNSAVYVLGRTLARHRPAVAVASAFLLLLIASTVALSVLYARAERDREAAERRGEALRRSNYFSSIAIAQNALENADGEALLRALADCPEDLRGWEWRFLRTAADTRTAAFDAHDGTIWTLAIDAAGDRILSGGTDRAVRLWTRDGELLRTLLGHGAEVSGVAFLDDESLIISASYDGTVRLWDTRTGAEVRSLTAHGGTLEALAVHADDRRFATAGNDGWVRVWYVDDTSPVAALRVSDEPLDDVAWLPGTDELVVADWTGEVHRVDPVSGSIGWAVSAHQGRVRHVVVAQDGSTVVSCGEDGRIVMLEAETGATRTSWSPGAARGAAFRDSGRRLATISGVAVRNLDLATGTEQDARLGPEAIIHALAARPDLPLVVTGDADGRISTWSDPPELPTSLTVHSAPARDVAISSDRARMVTAGEDGTVALWTLPHGALVWRRTIVEPPDDIRLQAVTFVDGDRAIAAAGRHGVIVLIDAADGAVRETWKHGAPVLGLAANNDRVAAAGFGGSVRLWRVGRNEPERVLETTAPAHRGLAFSTDGTELAATGYDGVIRVWTLAASPIPRLELTYGDHPLDVAFAPDGTLLAAAHQDGAVTLWNARTGELIQAWATHRIAQSVAFAPDGRCFVTGGYDRLLQVWDVESRRRALTLRAHRGGVPSVAFAPGGDWFASASLDRTVRIWRAGETGPVSPSPLD